MKRRTSLAPALGALILWAAGDKATHAVRGAWGGPGDATRRLNEITPALQREFSGVAISLDSRDMLGGLAAVVLVLLIIAYRRAGRQTERIGEEHGSAEWGGPRDFARFRPRKGELALQFTATETLSLNGRRVERNSNALVIGSAGSRKTRGFVIPNILAIGEASMANTDPKGEVYAATADRLEDAGYNVRALNLVDLKHSWKFNPFRYINPEQPEVSIAQLADTIVTNTDGQRTSHGGNDAFWERAERALLTSLIAYVYFTDNLDGDGSRPASLVNVVDLAKQLQASETDEKHRSEVDRKMADVRELLDTWVDLPDVPKEASDQVRDGLSYTVAQYRVFEQGAGETKKGVIISLGVRLAILDVPQVRRIMEDDTLALDALGDELGAVFCILPDTHQTFRFIGALFWQALFTTNVYEADHSPGGSLSVPLICFLDEFANIGTIPDFPQLISTVRSRGISVAVILQALTQLKAKYRDDWETIAGNCDSMLFLGGTEPTTTEWVSKRLGNSTIKVEENSQSYGSHGSWSRSLRNVKRELLTPDELGRLPEGECIYMLRGVKPFRSRKVPIFRG